MNEWIPIVISVLSIVISVVSLGFVVWNHKKIKIYESITKRIEVYNHVCDYYDRLNLSNETLELRIKLIKIQNEKSGLSPTDNRKELFKEIKNILRHYDLPIKFYKLYQFMEKFGISKEEHVPIFEDSIGNISYINMSIDPPLFDKKLMPNYVTFIKSYEELAKLTNEEWKKRTQL